MTELESNLEKARASKEKPSNIELQEKAMRQITVIKQARSIFMAHRNNSVTTDLSLDSIDQDKFEERSPRSGAMSPVEKHSPKTG